MALTPIWTSSQCAGMGEQASLVVLASGAGSTFAAIAEAVTAGRLAARVRGLVVSREGVEALLQAKLFGIESAVLDPKNFGDRKEWDLSLKQKILKWKPDWVVLAGYTLLLGPAFLKQFEGRVVNTHPSLLPKYGGHGMYGMKVHEAVIQAGERETGITIHHVTANYDEGPIIAQKRVPVEPGDTPQALATRLKQVERGFYVEVLARLVRR